MKVLGGVLGIVGGLLGLFVFFLYLTRGLGLGVLEGTGVTDALLGYIGGLAALSCVVAGIAAVFGPGWMAGVVLLVSALVGVTLGGHWLMSPAVIGGMIAIAHGRRRLSPEGLQQRIELEVQQRYGTRR
ncbi:MAG: hypothetical protein ACREEV_14225 [Dongiaceae bacterium]